MASTVIKTAFGRYMAARIPRHNAPNQHIQFFKINEVGLLLKLISFPKDVIIYNMNVAESLLRMYCVTKKQIVDFL